MHGLTCLLLVSILSVACFGRRKMKPAAEILSARLLTGEPSLLPG